MHCAVAIKTIFETIGEYCSPVKRLRLPVRFCSRVSNNCATALARVYDEKAHEGQLLNCAPHAYHNVETLVCFLDTKTQTSSSLRRGLRVVTNSHSYSKEKIRPVTRLDTRLRIVLSPFSLTPNSEVSTTFSWQ